MICAKKAMSCDSCDLQYVLTFLRNTCSDVLSATYSGISKDEKCIFFSFDTICAVEYMHITDMWCMTVIRF